MSEENTTVEERERSLIYAMNSHYPVRAKFTDQPEAVTIDIVERRHMPRPEGDTGRTGTQTFHIPNAVYINGQPVYTPAGTEIKVEANCNDATKVTMSFFARRVRFGHEEELNDQPA